SQGGADRLSNASAGGAGTGRAVPHLPQNSSCRPNWYPHSGQTVSRPDFALDSLTGTRGVTGVSNGSATLFIGSTSLFSGSAGLLPEPTASRSSCGLIR